MAAIHLASCSTPNVLEQDTSNTLLIVRFVNSEESGELQSDVCSNDSFTELTCTVVADEGQADLVAVLKNQNQLGRTFLNNVTINSYRVTYTRADGRNTPGVDVPFPFDGAANARVLAEVGETAGTNMFFTLVRTQAKLEPPLRNLAFGGGAVVLSVMAEIEFFGQDGAGRPLSAKGFINIHFADFAGE